MILFSNNYVLNEGAGINANSPVLLWNNVYSASNLVASAGEVAGFPASNLANNATDLFWQSPSTASQTIIIDVSGKGEIDCVAFARHNFATAGIAVSLAINTGAGYGADIVSPSIPADDGPLMLKFTPTTCTFIKITLALGSAAPMAAVLYVGRTLALQRRIYVGHTPINMGRAVTSAVGVSEGGDFLGIVVTGEIRQSNISMKNLTPAWYRQYLDPFIAVSRKTPFFFAWRPGTYPNEVGFCWVPAGSNPMPVNQRNGGGMMQIDIPINGLSS